MYFFGRGVTCCCSSMPRRGEMHVAFETTADGLDAWRSHLRSMGIPIEAEVEWPRGGRSLYIRDPDRHSIELVTRGIWGF